MIGGLITAAFALTAYSRAHAQEYYPPPKPGQVVSIPPNVLCDTKDQVVAIGQAGKDDFKGLLDKYQELATIKDAKGEADCAYEPVSQAMAGEIVPIGLAHGSDGGIYMTWAVEVKGDNGESLWVLLPLKEKTSESSSKS